MRIAACPIILPIGLLAFALGSAARATEALPTIEEHTLRTAVIVMCHATRSDEDKAYMNLAEAVGSGIFERTWMELNIADPSDLVANGRKADALLQHRLYEAADDAKKQVQEKGCAEMERLTAPKR